VPAIRQRFGASSSWIPKLEGLGHRRGWKSGAIQGGDSRHGVLIRLTGDLTARPESLTSLFT